MRTISLVLVLACFSILTPEANALPQLFPTDTHADTIFTDIGAGLTGTFAGNAAWFDYDNDGDLDVLVTGHDDSAYVSTIYRNDAGTFTDIEAGLLGLGTERGVTFGDYDNDGDLDIAVQGRIDPQNSVVYTKIYRNDDGVFTDIAAPLLGLDGGSTVWVDYDNDGKLDLFLCGSTDNGWTFHAKLYHQAGSGFEEVLTGIVGVWGSSASWGDYDNDGDKDLFLLGYGYGGVTTKLYRNDGWVFTDLSIPFPRVNSGASAWVDIDDDGDLDLTYSGASGPGAKTVVCRNLGFGGFSIVSTNLKDLSVSAIAWGDYDNDGDLDVAESGSEEFSGANPTTKIYRNDDGSFVDIDCTIPGTWFGSLAWGDYDNDGRLDLLVSGGTTMLDGSSRTHPITRIYRNRIGAANAPPTVPSNPIATVGLNRLDLAWDPSGDAETPQGGITYNIRLGTTPGGFDVVNASARSSGWRRIAADGNTGSLTARTLRHLPAGTYYWSVQSVDNGYAGSSFSAEAQVVVPDSVTDVSTLSVTASWNLLSLPRDPADPATSSVFPSAAGSVHGYDGTGYVTPTTMEGGAAYWVKFSHAEAVQITGTLRTVDTLTLKAGWNMIGGLSTPVPVSSIESDPPGITTSPFYSYERGYAPSEELLPGKGYWVKLPAAGRLILRSTARAHPSRVITVVSDAELPPPPPAGADSRPTAFRLGQNYPNPFNPSTSIPYSVATGGPARLSIYNVLGEEVARLVDGRLEPGEHVAAFDASALPSGMYTARLSSGGHTAVTRMLLVR